MARGQYDGMTISDDRIRDMFSRHNLLASDWYHQRLATKQQRDVALWQRHVDYLDDYQSRPELDEVRQRLRLDERQKFARDQLRTAQSDDYVKSLVGTLGADQC